MGGWADEADGAMERWGDGEMGQMGQMGEMGQLGEMGEMGE